jgi:hypothetical protein
VTKVERECAAADRELAIARAQLDREPDGGFAWWRYQLAERRWIAAHTLYLQYDR